MRLDHVVDLLMIEQFYSSCSQTMVTFINENWPKNLDELIECAYRYVESRSGWYASSSSKNLAKDCRKRLRFGKLAAALDMLEQTESRTSDNNGSDPRMTEGEKGCLLLNSCFSYSPHLDQIDRRTANKLPSVSVACGVKPARTMPVVRAWFLNDREVKDCVVW